VKISIAVENVLPLGFKADDVFERLLETEICDVLAWMERILLSARLKIQQTEMPLSSKSISSQRGVHSF